jgi:hypothetical protein
MAMVANGSKYSKDSDEEDDEVSNDLTSLLELFRNQEVRINHTNEHVANKCESLNTQKKGVKNQKKNSKSRVS